MYGSHYSSCANYPLNYQSYPTERPLANNYVAPSLSYFSPPVNSGQNPHTQPYQKESTNSSLRDALNASNFSLKPITGDGNCFFTAVADEIIRLMLEDSNFELHIFRVMDTTFIPTRAVLAHSLRHVCVRDWLKHEKYYSQFLKDKVNFESEARSFLQDGYFKSALGDLVPLTVANTLTVNLVIFTSNEDLPIIKVKPEYCSEEDAKQLKFIFLAYNQEGNGHYDVAIRKNPFPYPYGLMPTM